MQNNWNCATVIYNSTLLHFLANNTVNSSVFSLKLVASLLSLKSREYIVLFDYSEKT